MCSFFPENAQAFPYDPAKAKALLAEAGVKDLKLTLWALNLQDLINSATVLQGMLAQVGIQLDIQVLENGVFNDRMKTGQYDMFIGETRLSGNFDLTEFFRPYGSLCFGGIVSAGME